MGGLQSGEHCTFCWHLTLSSSSSYPLYFRSKKPLDFPRIEEVKLEAEVAHSHSLTDLLTPPSATNDRRIISPKKKKVISSHLFTHFTCETQPKTPPKNRRFSALLVKWQIVTDFFQDSFFFPYSEVLFLDCSSVREEGWWEKEGNGINNSSSNKFGFSFFSPSGIKWNVFCETGCKEEANTERKVGWMDQLTTSLLGLFWLKNTHFLICRICTVKAAYIINLLECWK